MLSRGALYLILQNRLYRGEITHKGNAYPGEHPAIVDKPLWDDVQAVLAANRIERTTGARASHPSLHDFSSAAPRRRRLIAGGRVIESCVNCFMCSTWPMRKARSSPTSFLTRTSNDRDGLAPGGQTVGDYRRAGIDALVAADLAGAMLDLAIREPVIGLHFWFPFFEAWHFRDTAVRRVRLVLTFQKPKRHVLCFFL
jgi:hypothetical protein